MNITWLDINSSYSHSSLALAAIEVNKTSLDNNWSKVSGTIQSDIFSITKDVISQKPDIVAATLWLFTHEVVMKMIRRIKALNPNIVVVLGGPEFNGKNEIFLRKNPEVALVLRGEGEVNFHKWLESFNTKSKWSEIEGACYLDHNDRYCDNGHARVLDFKSLKYPEESRFFDRNAPFIQLETSRGCFNTCAFCTSSNDKPIRDLELSEIEKRLEFIASLGIKEVRLLDRTFNYSQKRAFALIELFEKYPESNFHLEIHPALLKSESLRQKIASTPKNLLHIEAGLQSLSNEVLIASGRKGESDDAIEGVKFLSSLENLETHTDLIAGLPKYTFDQLFSDVQQLSHLNAGEIQLELLKLLPGTKMNIESESLGIKFALDPPYEVLETTAMSMAELDKSRLLSKLIDKFYNAKGWQPITRKLINENDDFLSRFFDYTMAENVLENPISLEKRGSILYRFCKAHYPSYLTEISLQWIYNGMSLKKEEAGRVAKLSTVPEGVEQENIRYYSLNRESEVWYIIGFNRSKEHSKPIFCKKMTSVRELL